MEFGHQHQTLVVDFRSGRTFCGLTAVSAHGCWSFPFVLDGSVILYISSVTVRAVNVSPTPPSIFLHCPVQGAFSPLTRLPSLRPPSPSNLSFLFFSPSSSWCVCGTPRHYTCSCMLALLTWRLLVLYLFLACAVLLTLSRSYASCGDLGHGFLPASPHHVPSLRPRFLSCSNTSPTPHVVPLVDAVLFYFHPLPSRRRRGICLRASGAGLRRAARRRLRAAARRRAHLVVVVRRRRLTVGARRAACRCGCTRTMRQG